MKLTKEEYIDIIEFLEFFYGDNLIATAELRKEKPKEIQQEDKAYFEKRLNDLRELINEHFDNNMARICQNLVSEIDKLDNEVDKINKALEKACELLETNVTKKQFCVDRYGEFDIDIPIRTKKEWKEYLLNER